MKKKTIIITVLSTIPVNNISKRDYICEYDDEYETSGYMTNEPGIKKILDEIKKENQEQEIKIIYIASDATRKQKDIVIEGSTYTSDEDYFKTFVRKQKLKVDFELHKCSDNASNNEIIQLSSTIMNKIVEDTKNFEINLYIECNGGARDFVTVLSSIAQTDRDNVKVKRIVGVNGIRDNTSVMNIVDKSSAYRITDFYSGVDEFVLYGRAGKLIDYFSSLNDIDLETKKVLDAIEEMADAFTLCYPKLMIKKIEELSQAINEYEEYSKYKPKQIMVYLCNRIKLNYKEIFDSIKKHKFGRNYEDFYIVRNLIKYCLDHKLIPQALTLFNELMPLIICNYGIVCPKEDQQKNHFINFITIRNRNKLSYDIKYIYYSQYIMLPSREKGALVNNSSYKGNDKPEQVIHLIRENWISTTVPNNEEKLKKLIGLTNKITGYRNNSNHANRDSENNSINEIISTIKESLEVMTALVEVSGRPNGNLWNQLFKAYKARNGR